MSDGTRVSKVIQVVVALAVLLGAAGAQRPWRTGAAAAATDRDKTGTSQGRVEQCRSQTQPHAAFAAGGALESERVGIEPTSARVTGRRRF